MFRNNKMFSSVLQKKKIVFFSMTFQERISAKICFHPLTRVNTTIKLRSLEMYGNRKPQMSNQTS